jgi:multidrug resistance efflux pump
MLRSETVQMDIKKALEMKRQGTVPIEEMKIKEAQVEAAKAELRAAIEARELAKAELGLADRELAEHTIVAPFTGYVMDRMKDPGEAVQLNEPVVRLGRIDKMQCLGKMPLDRAAQVQVGDLVEVQPFFKETDLDIEKLKFQGKIKNIGREVDSVGIGPPRVQIMAEIDNPYAADRSAGINMQLLDNMEAMVTIYLRPGADRPRTASAAAAGAPAPAR